MNGALYQQSYNRFMQSPEWRKIRLKVLRRDRWICRDCGRPANQVHHLRYDRGWDNPEYLVSICRECHAGIHARRTGGNSRLGWRALYLVIFVVRSILRLL